MINVCLSVYKLFTLFIASGPCMCVVGIDQIRVTIVVLCIKNSQECPLWVDIRYIK